MRASGAAAELGRGFAVEVVMRAVRMTIKGARLASMLWIFIGCLFFRVPDLGCELDRFSVTDTLLYECSTRNAF